MPAPPTDSSTSHDPDRKLSQGEIDGLLASLFGGGEANPAAEEAAAPHKPADEEQPARLRLSGS